MTFGVLSSAKRVAPAPTRLAKGKWRGATRFVGSRPGFVGSAPRLGVAPSPQPPEFQTKLNIGEPNDRFEREADRVADQVLRMPDSQMAQISFAGEAIQRKCATCTTGKSLCPKCVADKEQIHRKSLDLAPLVQCRPVEDDGEELLRTKAAAGQTAQATSQLSAQISALRGRGRPLPPSTRAFFEPRFGVDFSGVRVHTDGRAAELTRALNARAFTLGRDVVFGERQYLAGENNGLELLAHELVHVTQQGAAGPHGLHLENGHTPVFGVAEQERGGRALGAQLGKQVAANLFRSPFAPVWRQVERSVRNPPARESAVRELPAGGGTCPMIGGEKALCVTGGHSMCNLPGSAPIIVNNNDECTRPCTQLHEMKHVSDWGACCVRARAAFQAPGASRAAVMARWNAYLTGNEPWFECRAYGRSVQCANAMNAMLLCWAPEWLLRTVLVGGGALAGGFIGAQVVGAAGAGAGAAVGAGAGAAGGPAAPVTVPVGAAAGATAGFVTGEVLGFLAGAGIGALLGAGAEALREACCRQVQSYRAHVIAQRSANCAAAGGTPVCPF